MVPIEYLVSLEGRGDQERGDRYLIPQLGTYASDVVTWPLCLFEVGVGKIIQEWLGEDDREVKLFFTLTFIGMKMCPFLVGQRNIKESI